MDPDASAKFCAMPDADVSEPTTHLNLPLFPPEKGELLKHVRLQMMATIGKFLHDGLPPALLEGTVGPVSPSISEVAPTWPPVPKP